jgi:hypothetical protein
VVPDTVSSDGVASLAETATVGRRSSTAQLMLSAASPRDAIARLMWPGIPQRTTPAQRGRSRFALRHKGRCRSVQENFASFFHGPRRRSGLERTKRLRRRPRRTAPQFTDLAHSWSAVQASKPACSEVSPMPKKAFSSPVSSMLSPSVQKPARTARSSLLVSGPPSSTSAET